MNCKENKININSYQDVLQKIITLMIPENKNLNLKEIKLNEFINYLEASDHFNLYQKIIEKTLNLRIKLIEKNLLDSIRKISLDILKKECNREWLDLEKILTIPLINYYFSRNETLEWLKIEQLPPYSRNVILPNFEYNLLRNVKDFK